MADTLFVTALHEPENDYDDFVARPTKREVAWKENSIWYRLD